MPVLLQALTESTIIKDVIFSHHSKAVPLPPCKHQEGEEVQLLLNLDLGTRGGGER
jgi:hypothetical protein